MAGGNSCATGQHRRERRLVSEHIARREPIVTLIPRFALAALALMASLPFLVLRHTLPITSFHAEWLAATLGLVGSVVLIGARGLPLPGAALLALALAALTLGQLAVGRAPLLQTTVMFELYMLWTALLATIGSQLAKTLGQATLARTLASAILLTSFAVSLFGLLDAWLPLLRWPRFSLHEGGPLRQTNHLTTYLWLGLASALYLHTAAQLPARRFWAAVVVLTLAAVLVGKRSSFLYAFGLFAIAAWQARRSGGCKPDARRIALGIAAVFVLMQPVTMLLPRIKPPPALRAVQEFEGPSIRLQQWHVGIEGIMAAPLLGNGVGSYRGMPFAHADDIRPADNPGAGTTHAHNLFVELGAELGLPAALLVMLATGVWLRWLPRRAAPAEAAWAAAVVVMIGLHSMIEYPLWYSFFIGPLAIVAGAFGHDRRSGGRIMPAALALGLLFYGSVTLFELRRDYMRLEQAIVLGREPASLPSARAVLMQVPQQSLLAPRVAAMVCASLDPLRITVADGLPVCRVGMIVAPGMKCGVNTAVLLWRAGEIAEAQNLIRRMRRATAYWPQSVADLLTPLASREPGLRALNEGGP